MKTLIIVESPHKASSIQGFLGKDYIVLASKGHITELAKGGKFGLGVDIENNFKPRYVISEDHAKTVDELMKAANSVDNIILASDNDREGEAIAWHLQNRLEDIGKPIKRITFEEITKSAVMKALKKPRDVDLDIFHAQEARRILDRLVGFMASPFLMNFFGPKLSAGRVQSVVTRIVIDREREIEQFKPEDFWTIQVNLTNNTDNFYAKYPLKLTDVKSANDMYSRLSAKNTEYIVSNVEADEEIVKPFPPLITSTLQRIMSKEHGISSDRTMKAAQSLYESGYCSYIRTDSVRMCDEALDSLREYLKSNKYDIPKTPNKYKNKDAAQDAHECIRPTDINILPTDKTFSDPDQQEVYNAIWKYFVASQMPSAIYNTLKVVAHVKNDKKAEVKATGKALKYDGFLKILGIKDKGSIDIPYLNKGDALYLYGNKPVKMEKKQTQPPPRYSEDKLLKELEQRAIGRPATYADLLSKIATRNYVEKRGNVFHATDLGKKITDVLKKYFTFMDYEYTSKMEQQLDDIEHKKINHIDMLNKFYPGFKNELDKAYQGQGSELCPKCNCALVKRTVKRDGSQFWGCSGYPKCNFTRNI
jgi:DNA topoisomerase I